VITAARGITPFPRHRKNALISRQGAQGAQGAQNLPEIGNVVAQLVFERDCRRDTPRRDRTQCTPQTFHPSSRGTRNTVKSALALSLPSSIVTATVWPSTSLPQL